MPSIGYQIVVQDGTSDLCEWGLPHTSGEPLRRVYLTLSDAKANVKGFAESLGDFIPVLYGQAFPFESSSFEDVLHSKGVAVLGWIRMKDEEEEMDEKIAIGILRVEIA